MTKITRPRYKKIVVPKPPRWKLFIPTDSIAEKDGYYWVLREHAEYSMNGNVRYYRAWDEIDLEQYNRLNLEYERNRKRWN